MKKRKSVKRIFFGMYLLLLPVVAMAEDPVESRNTLFQASTSNGIVVGNFDGETTAGQMKEHGNFGIAVADALAGEMMLLDGIWYQVFPDETVRAPDDSLKIPFGMVAYFHPELEFTLGPTANYQELRSKLDRLLPSRNIFYAVKIEGHFTKVKNRSFARQSRPYRNQAVVTDEQKIFETTETDGALIGFWVPAYISGVNLPGLHLHYLSADRRHGGHTLDVSVRSARIYIQPLYGYQINLQHSADFLHADLAPDRTREIKKVHGR